MDAVFGYVCEHGYLPPRGSVRRADHGNEPRIIGIDDWAWRKGQRYGALICDLERRAVIDLLPDREPATVAAWLRQHPQT
ncbi:transposase [Sulfitobacter sp. 1A13368]|uniref:transposase n=1 Tax=Sulfitobacter sp. 1A13368 TaxID=3368593 RepID=UPI0037465041